MQWGPGTYFSGLGADTLIGHVFGKADGDENGCVDGADREAGLCVFRFGSIDAQHILHNKIVYERPYYFGASESTIIGCGEESVSQ